VALAVRYLADKSALARLRHPEVTAALAPLLLAGEVGTCSVIELEILYSARNAADLAATRATRAQAFTLVTTTQADFDRAMDVMEQLARRGLHRSVGIPNLLIAAVAERNNLTIIHYDAEFEFVTAVTGQPMQWVVPRGTIP
jgi:predicted nucleic acid-binding protein